MPDYRWTPPGEMRSVCQVLSPSTSQDTKGQKLANWTTLYANVMCKATIKGGSKEFSEQQFQPRIVWEIRMRYLPGITALNGITIGPDAMDTATHFLDVQTAEDIQFRHRELLIVALERLNYQEFGDAN
jgi:hypothetical protein